MNTTTPATFVASVADRLHEIAQQARSASGTLHNGTAKPSSSLDIVVRAIRAQADAARPTTHPRCDAKAHEDRNAITDTRWFLLWLACDEAIIYQPEPRSEQARLAGRLGLEFGGYADVGRVVSVLACAALRDRVRALRQQEAVLTAEREQMAAARADLADVRCQVTDVIQRADEIETQRKAMADELLTRNQQLAHEREITAFYRSFTGAGPDPGPEAAEHDADTTSTVALADRPRRVKVPGLAGIYTNPNGAYEVLYRNADGRKRSKVIGDDLDEAIAARAELAAANQSATDETTK